MSYSPSAPPLDQPYYGAPLTAAVSRFFKKYATFSGRASRSEYWWWWLVSLVVSGLLQVLALATGGIQTMPDGSATVGNGIGLFFFVLLVVWGLAVFIPGLALLVRRLHDSNRSGFWVFIVFVPFVGGIVLLVFVLLGSNPQGARFDR